jgi:hypothetical protein
MRLKILNPETPDAALIQIFVPPAASPSLGNAKDVTTQRAENKGRNQKMRHIAKPGTAVAT